MYPGGELIALGRSKAVLRRRITVRRWQCVDAATSASRSLAWVDRLLAGWRRISPLVKLAAVPLVFRFRRPLVRRTRRLATAMRWLPFVLEVARTVRAAWL